LISAHSATTGYRTQVILRKADSFIQINKHLLEILTYDVRRNLQNLED